MLLQQSNTALISEGTLEGALRLYQDLYTHTVYNSLWIVSISDYFASQQEAYTALYQISTRFSESFFPWNIYYHSITQENPDAKIVKTKRLALPNKSTIFLTDYVFSSVEEYCVAYIKQLVCQGYDPIAGEGKTAATMLCAAANINTGFFLTQTNKKLLDMAWEAAEILHLPIGEKPY